MGNNRLDRLFAALHPAGLDALALNPGPSLTYFTGLHFHLMERPVVALFPVGAMPVIILPELESGKLSGVPYPVQAFTYGENPATWQGVFDRAAAAVQFDSPRIGVEPTRLRFLELRLLENALPAAHFDSAQAALAAVRMRKEPGEIEAMRQAVRVAQEAFLAFLPSVKPGVTERQLASELTLQLLRLGSSPELPFSPIIASGPNAANPHAAPTDRPLQMGDSIVVDWGAGWEGYCADLTRTLSLGEPGEELARIARIVGEANRAALRAARLETPIGQVDQAARAVIEAAGYGPQFFHRTGHGLGMEDHEEPYVYADNSIELEPGMTFTDEPGIYLAGRMGVRIEDDLVMTENGAESMSDLPRELYIIP